MTDAIQQDAPQEVVAAQADEQIQAQQDQQTEERPLSPRERAMAEIAESRRNALHAEAGIQEPESTVETPAQQVEEQVSAQAAPEVIAGDFDNVKVRAKIDGEEVEVTLDQVMRQFQKHSAADKRLAEATRLLREAEERALQLAQQQAAPTAETVQEKPNTKEFLEALFQGDEESAARALEGLVQGRQQVPTPDPAAIAQQVKQQIEVESALSGFAKDYADIVADPYLADMADRELEQRLQQGEAFKDALRASGEAVRGWLQSKTGASQETTASTTRTERLDRKASLDTVRTANVTASSPTQQPRSEEQIRADALAALIKSRPGMTA